jgi:excisionase family DNA binding protein
MKNHYDFLGADRLRELMDNRTMKLTNRELTHMRDILHGMADVVWCQLALGKTPEEQAEAASPPPVQPKVMPVPPHTPAPSAKEFFRIKEASMFLGVSTRTVYRLLARGVIPCYKPSPQLCLFRRRDLNEAMERCRIEGGAID